MTAKVNSGIVVSSSSELATALRDAKGGETIYLAASSKHYSLSLSNIDPSSTVTIKSLDSDNPAVFDTLKLNMSSNIAVDGVTFSSGNADRASYLSDIFITYSDNIAIRNSVLKGIAMQYDDGKVYVGEDAVKVRATNGFVFENNEVSNYRFGIQVTESQNISIRDNDIHDMQADGLQFGGVQDVEISGNYIHDFLGSAMFRNHTDMIQFYTTGTTKASANISITNNVLDSGTGSWTQAIFMGNEAVARGNAALYYENVLIAGNTIHNNTWHGITTYEVKGLQILGNHLKMDSAAKHLEFSNDGIYIIVADKSSDVTVDGNLADKFLVPAPFLGANNLTTEQKLAHDALDTRIIGTAARDSLKGTAGNNLINGLGGNDSIHGGAGNDQIFGGDGNDTLTGDAGADQLSGDLGNDTINGSDGNDTIDGGAGNDKLYGDAGDDSVTGGEGNDQLYGGAGNDILTGGAGSDYLNGGAGNDRLFAGDGSSSMFGEDGDDFFFGGAGKDHMQGGNGNDVMYGGNGDDTLRGDDGNDIINAGAGNDGLRGGKGDDTLLAGDGNDMLWGEAGDDILAGGLGKDSMYGGEGRDTFLFNTVPDGNRDAIADFEAGVDTIALDRVAFKAFNALDHVSADNIALGAAQDPNDYLIYKSGNLYYDADGNGSGAMVVIANIAYSPVLTADSFALL